MDSEIVKTYHASSLLISSSPAATTSSIFYADIISLTLFISISLFFLSISFSSCSLEPIYLVANTIAQHLYTVSNFIYFGLESEDGPLYWSYKCASANGLYRDMMGGVCEALGSEKVLVSLFALFERRDETLT